MRHLIFVVFGCALIFGAIGAAEDAPAAVAQADDRVVTMSPPGESYIDPEILPGGALMTYQSQGGIYLAALDPATGLFVSVEGKDVLMDTGATRPIETFNGPEFGIDAAGWALYYAKPHHGTVQIWRATLNGDGTSQPEPLSTGERHQTQLVSRNPRAESTRIAAIRGTWQAGTAVWFDESDPSTDHDIATIENGIASLRWIDNSYQLTYSQRTGPDRGQVLLLDTATNAAQVITNDAGDKTDPYGWYAPDFGGEMLVLAIVDNAAVAVYRDTGGAYWERIATLQPPPEAGATFISSAEPFVVGGRSYISLIIKNATDTRERFSHSEVWLFDVNEDPTTRYTERCDSGESGLARSDPEVFIGEQNVFVYYNVIDGPGVTPYEVRRCRSELTAAGTSASRSVAQTDPEVCQWVSPQDTDPQIDSALAPHYVCLDPSVSQRGRLLVFFPGTAATPEDYELFAEEGAAVGLHTISLSYPNPRSVNLQICPGDPDPNCHENARREVIYGQDLHSGVSVDEPNAIVNRIVHLLRFLHEQTPDAGWDQYLDGDMPRWEHIVVAGHSQGAGMAAYLAHAHPVARAILFAWVDQSQGNVAPWILEAHATPPERIYYFEHVADHERGKIAKGQMLEAFGLHALGEANIDTTIAPYGDAHVLFTSVTPAREGARASAGAHNVVIGDDFTPVENGVPALREVWRYLLDVPN